MKRFALVLVLLVLGVSPAAAQVDDSPVHDRSQRMSCDDLHRLADGALPKGTRIDRGVAAENCDYVQLLTNQQIAGQLGRMRGLASEIVAGLKASPIGDKMGDLKRDFYRILWVGGEKGGTLTLRSVIIKVGDTEQSYDTLPGVGHGSATQLIEVFIHADENATIETHYLSTAVADPLLAQIGAFVEKTQVVNFLSTVPALRGGPTDASRKDTPLSYTVATVPLSMKRATIKTRDVATVPGNAPALAASSEKTRTELKIREARLSPCAQSLADAHAAAITEGLKERVCVVSQTADASERRTQATACRDRLTALLTESYARVVPACRDAAPIVANDPALVVDAKFVDLVKGLDGKTYAGDTTITNTPLTRLSFGLTAGVVLHEHYSGSTVRAKVGSTGTLVHDPLPSVVTMAVVNISPAAYNAAASSITRPERFRFFAGTALTPDFGIGGGAAFLLVRGLSVNAGWVNLFVKSPADGLKLDDNTAHVEKPLQYGSAGVFFAGLSYNFK